jgi:actin-related protein 6
VDMPSRSKVQDGKQIKEATLVVDNGAFTIKAGFASPTPDIQDCRVIPNCVARDRERQSWIGPELENCKDFGELSIRRPVEKGYVVNWESERAIWNQSFFGPNAVLKVCCSPATIYKTS